MKTKGLFLVIILFVLRLVIVPAHQTIEKKKGLLSELQSAYVTKQQLMQRYLTLDMKEDPALEKELTTTLYPKDSNKTAIQTELIQFITMLSEKRALNVLNFQMLDSIEDPVFSEAAVLVRVSGQIKTVIELLKELLNTRPLLMVKDIEINGSGSAYTVKLIVAGYIRKI
ncbi:MAG: hypothetical protein HQL06_07740 [Nitrospirae bacterium]|nr:hypothetical protein [Nitrospirota bacterium]